MLFSGVGNTVPLFHHYFIYSTLGILCIYQCVKLRVKISSQQYFKEHFQVTTMFPSGRLWVWILVLFELLSQANGSKEDSATSILGISIFSA